MAIVAGLMGWAVPTFRDFQRNAARTREVNQFVQAIYLARGEAIKRNGVVSLCPSVDGSRCAAAGSRWQTGWLAFANQACDQPTRGPGSRRAIAACRPGLGQRHDRRKSAAFFVHAFGWIAVIATVTSCDERGTGAARVVVISQPGRPRVSDRSAPNNALICT